MTPTRTTYFMLLEATAHWRGSSREKQRAIFDEALVSVFNAYAGVRMSHFEGAGFHSRCTDLIVWEVQDVAEYQAAIDSLHDGPLFGAPCFEIIDVIAGIDDGWREDESDAIPFDTCVL